LDPALRGERSRTLVLLDAECPESAEQIAEDGTVVYWSAVRAPHGSFSLQTIVEQSSESLREDYVNWCGDLSQAPVGKRSLAGALSRRLLGGGSFWWMTIISVRSPVSSLAVVDVLRLRALETFYVSGAYRRLCYLGANTRLGNVLRTWCHSLGHEFIWRPTPTAAPEMPRIKRPRLNRLPHPLQALLQLAYFVRRRHLAKRRNGRRRPRPLADAELAVVTYFPNIDMAEWRQGRFRSHYWGPLHELIEDLGFKVNWTWLHHDASQLDYRGTVAFRDTLNQQSAATGQRYLMLEDGLTVRGVIWAIWTFLCLSLTSLRVEHLRDRFRFPGGTLNFFEILKDEWYSSLRGAAAMSACLHAAAFRNTVDELPATTSRVMYPWENLGWEHSLLCAWKRERQAPALAAVHTPGCTAAMYLTGIRGPELAGQPQDRVLPDRLVAFGRPAAETLREWGWPAQIVTEAEALRYMQFAGKYDVERRDVPKASRHLLLVTAMRAETEFQLGLLSAASRGGGLAAYEKVTIKPHPFCAVDDLVSALTFSRPVVIDQRPLDVLFGESDVVFAGNSTSAGIEAAWVGLPLILTASIGLNLNPLKGIAGVSFVATVEALVEQLHRPLRIRLAPDTFLLDRNLPRWRALLTQPLTAIN